MEENKNYDAEGFINEFLKDFPKIDTENIKQKSKELANTKNNPIEVFNTIQDKDALILDDFLNGSFVTDKENLSKIIGKCISEVKWDGITQVTGNLYRYESDGFVVYGTEHFMDEMDKSVLESLLINKTIEEQIELTNDIFENQPPEVNWCGVDYDGSLRFGRAINPRITWASESWRGFEQIGGTVQYTKYKPLTSLRRNFIKIGDVFDGASYEQKEYPNSYAGNVGVRSNINGVVVYSTCDFIIVKFNEIVDNANITKKEIELLYPDFEDIGENGENDSYMLMNVKNSRVESIIKFANDEYLGKTKFNKYNVVTLCGSTKFKDEYMDAQKRLTLDGNIVISVGLFGHNDPEFIDGLDEQVKEMLDDMHKAKIDMANEIFVINVGGYVGSSTKSEIEYAIRNGKRVRYLEPLE